MKRRKKQPSIPGQLGLFDVVAARQPEESGQKTKIRPVEPLKSSDPTLIPPAPVEALKTPQNGLKTEIPGGDELNRLWEENPEALHALKRQQEGSGRKTKIKPVEALKSSDPTLMPPAPVEALKTPQNGLKTEIPDGDELNRLWEENPEALHALNRMTKKNPAVLSLVRRLVLVPLCISFLFSCTPQDASHEEKNPRTDEKNPSAIERAVSFIAVLEGWHDPVKTGCTGWGHRCDYDHLVVFSPSEADSLAASDLMEFCSHFRDFQSDSLLLALLAYNVGVKAVKTSSLMDSLTFDAYTSFCYINGKRSDRQFQRRRAEWMLLKN